MNLTVKETGLTQETSIDADEIQTMQVRLIGADGKSKRKIISEFILKLANIYGLTTALAGKIGLKATGSPDFITKFLTTGDIDFSDFKISTFDSLIAIDTLGNGFYTAAGTGSGYVSTVWGSTNSVFEMNGQQLVFTSTGVWMRSYSGSWSSPTYVGGAAQNIVVTYAEAAALVADGGLSVGAVYSIEDFDVTGYLKIILTAATGSSFFEEGSALLPVPKYRKQATGILRGWSFLTEDSIIASGDITYAYGKVYSANGTSLGTCTDWILDSTNWTYLSPTVYTQYYINEWHTILYDFTSNFVKQESNINNVVCHEYASTNTDGFQTRFNDWATDSSNGDGFNDYWNISCRRLTKLYDSLSHYGYYAHEKGLGDINISGDIENVWSTIQYVGAGVGFSHIYGDGSLKNLGTKLRGGGLSGLLKNGSVLENIEFGAPCNLTVEKSIDGSDVILDQTQSINHIGYGSYTAGQICGSYTVAPGLFTLPSNEDSKGAVVTGCELHAGYSNGVKVDTVNKKLTVLVSGYYEIYVNTTAKCSAAATVITFVPAAGDEYNDFNSAWYNSKKYATNDDQQSTTLPVFPVWLDAGTDVEIYYFSSAAVTITLEWMTVSLKLVSL